MGMEGMAYSGMTPAEATLVANQTRADDNMWGGNGMWVFFLFFLLAWGNGGLGGFGNGAAQGALTRSELCQDMNFQSMENAVRGIQNGLCDGFYAQNTTMLQGFNGLQRDLCSGFNGINQNINQSRFDAQQCCCETNRNIDAVRYENAKNTCDIITAGHQDTQRIIDHLTQDTIQNLRDQVQTANFQLSQQAQSSNLINQLRPCPIPAYPSCSPYQVFNGWGGWGNGCCGSGSWGV